MNSVSGFADVLASEAKCIGMVRIRMVFFFLTFSYTGFEGSG